MPLLVLYHRKIFLKLKGEYSMEDWVKYSEGCTGHKSYEYAAKKKKIGKGAFFSFLFVFLFFYLFFAFFSLHL